jgi:FixJ family two-component response regulator
MPIYRCQFRAARRRGQFLTKPVRDQDLLDAIQLAIAQDRARRDNERAVANPSWLLRHADAA